MASATISRKMERASRKMLHIRDAYLKAFPNERATLDPKKIAEWAWENNAWRPTETDPREVLRRKLSRAFRHEYLTPKTAK